MLKQWLSVNMTSIAIMQLLMLLQLLTVIQQLLTMTRLLPLTPEVAASVVFKVQNHTVMFEYMGMEVEADMKQRLVLDGRVLMRDYFVLTSISVFPLIFYFYFVSFKQNLPPPFKFSHYFNPIFKKSFL